MSGDVPPSKAEVRFHQAAPPPLKPGAYTLKVTQTLTGAKSDAYTAVRQGIEQVYPAETAFTVSGPRFYLKPSDVYSVHPPAGQFGPFDNALPHIVFTRRTLPWERSIDGKPQDVDRPVPWCALLLVGRGDFEDGQLPKVTPRTVASLLEPGGEVQGPKGLVLEPGQTMDDLCNTVDLPVPLFAEIVPSLEDLPFLAHVREIKTGGKETLSLKQDGFFTVVMGTRLPATCAGDKGETNLACLVSLEGFGAALPVVDVSGRATVLLDEGKNQVRLAVLASWSFTCHGKNDFKTKMKALDDSSLLMVPARGLKTGDGAAAVRRAFELGYVGLNHTTRLGEKTVSWYRGPLVPLKLDLESPYAFIPCADRALRYDFQRGLFATEYAAAYELGRMMALQNRAFAAAMYRYRNRVLREIAVATTRGELGLGGAGAFDDAVARLFLGGSTPVTSPKRPEVKPGAGDPSPGVSLVPPAEVTRFLARAVLLYGVPFQYLVPDERMLPRESIRFFYLDPGWISTLLQGATSVGRIGERDTVLDTYLRHHALELATRDAAKVRERSPVCDEPKTTEASWPLSGCLLRSEVVEGWQGLEMRVTGKDKNELPPLRIDRLAPDLLLCIFNGEVMKLTVKQPPEGLHFGLSPDSDGNYQRLSLRKVTEASGGVLPGEQILDGATNPRNPPIQAPMRQASSVARPRTRCVRVAAFAETLRAGLAAVGHPTKRFTSAELAVQMAESPGLVEFTAPTEPPRS